MATISGASSRVNLSIFCEAKEKHDPQFLSKFSWPWRRERNRDSYHQEKYLHPLLLRQLQLFEKKNIDLIKLIVFGESLINICFNWKLHIQLIRKFCSSLQIFLKKIICCDLFTRSCRLSPNWINELQER